MDRNRNESSRSGEQQSEGNLGNERNRNSEDMVNRSSEGSSVRERSRESEDQESGEDWSPSGETRDNNDSRRGGSSR